MNVAVPSAQHSDRFGQPASSHTVTRPSARTVRLSASTVGAVVHLRAQPLGLAGPDRQPADDPGLVEPAAGAPVAIGAGGEPARRRPLAGRAGAAGERRQVVGPVPPRDVLALGASAPPPLGGEARRARRRPRRIVAVTPSSRSDVTGRSAMPHATMCWRMYVRSVATLRAKPCIVRPSLSRTPMAQILRGSAPSASTHTPGYSASRPASTPKAASVSMTSCSTLRTCCGRTELVGAPSGSGSRRAGPGPW